MKITKIDIYAIGAVAIGAFLIFNQGDNRFGVFERPAPKGRMTTIQCFTPDGRPALQDYAFGQIRQDANFTSFYSESQGVHLQTNLPCILHRNLTAEQVQSVDFALRSPEFSNSRFEDTAGQHLARSNGETPKAVIDPSTMPLAEPASDNASNAN